MGKSSRNTILTAIASGIVLGATAIIILRVLKPKRFSYKEISKFIDNPEGLNTRDDKDSWNNINQELLSVLKKVSNDYGSKLHINSGYRSQAHNDSIPNSAKSSAHLDGDAVDIHTGSYSNTIRMGRIAKKHGIVRMGIANSYIHLDVAKDKSQTRWTYNGMSQSKVDRDLGFA